MHRKVPEICVKSTSVYSSGLAALPRLTGGAQKEVSTACRQAFYLAAANVAVLALSVEHMEPPLLERPVRRLEPAF